MIAPPDYVHIEPENIDFDVNKEDWSIYEVEKDRTILKLKFVLVKVYLTGIADGGNPFYGINPILVIGAFPPKELRGHPSTRIYGPQELMDSTVEEDLSFKPIKEDWNQYLLKDGTKLSIKLELKVVSRTSLYDKMGEPIYNVQADPIIKAFPTKELRKKLSERNVKRTK